MFRFIFVLHCAVCEIVGSSRLTFAGTSPRCTASLWIRSFCTHRGILLLSVSNWIRRSPRLIRELLGKCAQVCAGSGSDDILDIIMRLVDADTCIISPPTFGMCVVPPARSPRRAAVVFHHSARRRAHNAHARFIAPHRARCSALAAPTIFGSILLTFPPRAPQSFEP